MAANPMQMVADAIRGKSDDEVLALVAGFGGIEPILDQVFEGLRTAVDPALALDSIVGFKLRVGETTHQYTFEIKDKSASVAKRDPAGARVVVAMTAVDFLRLLVGELDGMQAFMSGRVTAEGDIMFVQQFFGMFRQG